MKTIYGLVLIVFFSGCGYSRSQTRIVANPNGFRVSEYGNCVGLDCDNRGLGYGYGPWIAGVAPYQWGSPAGVRLGVIEVYRAQNQWIRSNGTGTASGTRDPRLDMLVPHLRRMANAMCRNGTITGADCAAPARMNHVEPDSATTTETEHQGERQ